MPPRVRMRKAEPAKRPTSSSATQEQVAGSDEASDDTRSESEDNAQTRKFGSRVSTKGYARRRNFMDDFMTHNL